MFVTLSLCMDSSLSVSHKQIKHISMDLPGIVDPLPTPSARMTPKASYCQVKTYLYIQCIVYVMMNDWIRVNFDVVCSDSLILKQECTLNEGRRDRKKSYYFTRRKCDTMQSDRYGQMYVTV